jgi:hypothetical protein
VSGALADAELEGLVDARLLDLRGRLGPHLRAAYDDLARRLGLVPERRDGPGYFFGPLALPVLQLPAWAGRELPAGDVADLVESAATGYLHVRVQDDLLDEGVGEPGAAMLLAEAFMARHQALLARVVGASDRFWALFERRWWAYGEAMLLERRLHAGEAPYDDAAFAAVLGRSLPLVLPAAAALDRAERWAALPDLEALVAHLARGHQLFHDVTHLDKDRRLGARTFVAWRFGPEHGHGHSSIWRRLLLEGGLDQVVAETLAELDLARAAAARADLPEAAASLAERGALVVEIQRETFAALFARILATGPPKD